MKQALLVMGVLAVVGVGAVLALRTNWQARLFQPRQNPATTSAQPTVATPVELIPDNAEVVAESLDIPWELVFLENGDLLVTQRPGSLVRISPDDRQQIPVAGVEHVGEGGLMGLALHPNFSENNWLYLYLTSQSENGLINRVERYTFDAQANQLRDRQVIIDNIPGARYHDGGRIAFGPDGLLYITTGDAGDEPAAQDTNSLAGKILRLNDDGSVPSDNPFNNPVYSYGHRNPQGLAWDDQGRLWATEHGPSGLQSGYDEINLIEAGQNYGWPTIRGDQTQSGMQTPIIQSGADDTWAPAAAEIINETLYFVGLRGQAVYTAQLIPDSAELTNFQTLLPSEYGRLRVVKQGPDGALYLATSNTDGRGQVQAGDDRIIRFTQ